LYDGSSTDIFAQVHKMVFVNNVEKINMLICWL